MSAVDLEAVLAGLQSFQRDAVEHVARQFYGPDSAQNTGRFLIADETGLGKSVIARGVVAKTIRRLEADEDADGVSIAYICSNQDLAQQNLRRLNVTGQTAQAVSTRLSLLAAQPGTAQALSDRSDAPADSGTDLTDPGAGETKPISLRSFTPGTSFSVSAWRQGNADERALLTLMLDEILAHDPAQRHTARVMLTGSVSSVERFSSAYVEPLRTRLTRGADREILAHFRELSSADGTLSCFAQLRDQVCADGDGYRSHWDDVQNVIARLRRNLSHAGVAVLRPDLIILDEFQRFRDLLDPDTGGEAAELADALFSFPDAKVLLLSATPYKPFTRAEEETDHHRDFLATLTFLFRNDTARVEEADAALREYRRAVTTGREAGAAAARVRRVLLPVMSRSERPPLLEDRDLVEVRRPAVPVPTPAEITDWVALSRMGEIVNSPVSIEQWKSVPHFVSFMDGYRISRRLRDAAAGPLQGQLEEALSSTAALSRQAVERRARIDSGNGPLRALEEQIVDRGLWKLLWIPPSMPYLQPEGVFLEFADADVTKHLLFSAWQAAPTAVTALLSHEADRRMRGFPHTGMDPAEQPAAGQRLAYATSGDSGLSTLALFWPHPELTGFADQLENARAHGGLVAPARLLAEVEQRLPAAGRGADQAWQAFLALANPVTEKRRRLVSRLRAESTRADRLSGLEVSADTALAYANTGQADEPLSHPQLARLAAFAPGSIAYRSLQTIAGPRCTADGVWIAALVLAEGLRTLFNRPESQALLDQLYPQRRPGMQHYWHRVLQYCADGNLRAVLDEYLFQLCSETGGAETDDEELRRIAETAAAALSMRLVHYSAREALADQDPIRMQARFAVRYGGGASTQEDGSAAARHAEVRNAFNSPFAPFVLASTSVGQEGIDFHWWSHAVIHWNLPSNPVDFEQREGRVNRYAGHAVRKNVAARHWMDVLTAEMRSPWAAAFAAASEEAGGNAGAGEECVGAGSRTEFSPWWVFPGPARIQRVLVQYPFSTDIEKYEALRSALVLYRLTLGQPRQEDMLAVLERNGVEAETLQALDLRPPQAGR